MIAQKQGGHILFGVNDGLLSNASLILGVAGAAAEPGMIVLSGVAGLLAGAFSITLFETTASASTKWW